MNHRTTLEELKEEIKLFCEARKWDQFHGIKDLAIGLVTEAAELLEIFRFQSVTECEAMFAGPQREAIEHELADVFFFLLRISQKYDIDLIEAFHKKMQLNSARYPIEKSAGSNRKYTEL